MLKNKKQLPIYLVMLSAFALGLSRLPVHLGFFSFIGFLPLFHYFNLKERKLKDLVLAGFAYSAVFCFTGLNWISLVTLGGFIGIIFLFTIYNSFLFYFINKVWHRFPRWRLLSFASLWISLELYQNFTELRFPWADIGYSMADFLPLIQIADIGGIYLLSFLMIVINYLIYQSITNKSKKNLISIAVIFAVWLGYGIYRMNTIELVEQDEKIAIMQPSIPQDQKWDFTYLKDNLKQYTELTKSIADSTTSMVIWPESCLPVPILRNDYYNDMIATLAIQEKMAIFAGFPDRQMIEVDGVEQERHYNAASLIRPNGEVDKPYYKNYLVPFGERMVLLNLFPSLRNLDLGQANWEYGEEINIFELNGFRFAPQICFEVAFPEHMYRALKGNIDYVVNITNDAWFYYSAGTYQHAMLNRFRAIEARKQIYRAANTGISLVIDPVGRILKSTELFEQTSIVVPLFTTNAKSLYYEYFFYVTYLFPILALLFIIPALLRKPKKQDNK
ncbi:MAG: apolipoprotein N-acyltransferase [Candidatus Zophobacter franzmannii]|nr:apolipoprotein N-acyltransferase [Candidatus Zophobacter franzmannii]